MKKIKLTNLENKLRNNKQGRYYGYYYRYTLQPYGVQRIYLGSERTHTITDIKTNYKVAMATAYNLQMQSRLGQEVILPSANQVGKSKKVLLKDFFDEWVSVEKNRSKSWIRDIHNMKPFVSYFGKESDWVDNRVSDECTIDLNKIDANDIDKFYIEQGKTFSKSTVRGRNKYLNPMYRWLVKNKYLKHNYYLEKNPLNMGKEKVEYQALTLEQIHSIIDRTDNQDYKVLWTIMAYSGLAPIDACSLDQRNDVVSDGKYTLIVKKRRKTKVQAMVPIVGDLDKLGDLIFTLEPRKSFIDKANVQFKRLAKSQNIIAKDGYKICQYGLRHSIISILRPYLTDNETALFVGHTDLKQQQTYTQQTQAMFEKFESVLTR